MVDALGSGADNFIRKPVDPAELLAHVNAGWRIVQLERSLRAANEQIRRLTVIDPLVGTFNRRHLDDELLKEVERARRYGHCLSAVSYTHLHSNSTCGVPWRGASAVTATRA